MRTFSAFTAHPAFHLAQFVLKRALVIGATIFVGITLTVIIANQDGQLEATLSRRVQAQALSQVNDLTQGQDVAPQVRAQLIEETTLRLRLQNGLEAPAWQRQLRWAYSALTFDWGDITFRQFRIQGPSQQASLSVKNIILGYLPYTLLLVSVASLIIFVVGLPLALSLSRQPGSVWDRLLTMLAPLSTFPSWVVGLVLLLIFAIQWHLVPIGGLQPIDPSYPVLDQLLHVFSQLLLPTAAIVISLFFQFVYTWRSYFLSYATEDYVELAQARGLPNGLLQRRYILRPTLPFIITNFMLSIVSFWQMAIALEVVFQWPGIGLLYVDSLPNFFGESMFPGEMVITVGLVTTFAYILGFTVLMLEISYALIDPRIRVDSPPRLTGIFTRRRRSPRVKHAPMRLRPTWGDTWVAWRANLAGLPDRLRGILRNLQGLWGQFKKYPAAVVGLVIILSLVIVSLFALIALPYVELGISWYTESVTGQTYVPRAAMPDWVNLFQGTPLLSAIILDSAEPGEHITRANLPPVGDSRSEDIVYTFDFSYEKLPEEIFLYFETDYDDKRPFVFWTWTKPNGEVIDLVSVADPGYLKMNLVDYVFRGPGQVDRLLDAHPALSDLTAGELPLLYLFTASDDPNHAPLLGRYQLHMTVIHFEEASELEAELVMLGQVYGAGGTDAFRRDLILPLVWGMPFALIFGLLGATICIFVALFLGAAAAWYGGWADWFVQRITDLNMVLPILAICVVFYAYYGVDIWLILLLIVLFSSFGSPVKTFRSAFLQVRESSYIEAARSYGASDLRIIFRYMIPKIMPVLIPQLIYMIPYFVFLEATLGMFNIRMDYPTWGRIIYDALNEGLTYGTRFWVFQPLALIFLTGLAFALVGFALDKILNPKLDSAN